MMRHTRFSILFLAALLAGLLAAVSLARAAAQPARPQVLVLTGEGALTPSMFEYLKRGLQRAEREGAEAVIFQLDTPGGSLDVMQEFIQAIRSSPVPVIVYVAPRNAMAGSAGTLVTLAGHAAAMAPETTIGAASPVGGQGEDLGQTMQSKIKNEMKATVRGLAERRGPEAVTLAEETIESAHAASAKEALQVGLVDFIASDVDDLLRQLDGFQVETAGGPKTLQTASAVAIPVNLTLIERLLMVLTNPNVVFLLITIGVQAILIEISSPGGWVAGFIGVVCLALATYGLGILPVNWFGIIFMLTAFVLFILDIKAPTHGALTVAGVSSFIIGALVLFNSPTVPSFQRVSVPLVVGASVITGAMFFIILLFALKAQKTPVRVGQESLLGRVGTVRTDLCPEGIVQMGGEQWSAELLPGENPALRGARVQVVRVEGLKLIVRNAR